MTTLNFCTPKNDFFYSKFQYLSLDSRRREIRLLRLYPRKSYARHIAAKPDWALIDEANSQTLNAYDVAKLISSHREIGIADLNLPILACELLDKTALSRVSGGYCALSYCAGKPTDTALILINGLPFNAFANLEHAMDLALKHWTSKNTDRQLLLWVDQICINQRDYVERASQVSVMRDVYRRSSDTFICLSTPSSTDCLAWVPCSSPEARNKNRNSVHQWKQTIQEWILPARWSPFVSSGLQSDRVETKALEETDFRMDSLQAFLGNPWWYRAWVYQEFISSPQPHFISTSVCVSWAEMLPLVEWICFDLDEFLESILTETTTSRLAENIIKSEQAAVRVLAVDGKKKLNQEYEQQLYQYPLDVTQYKNWRDGIYWQLTRLEEERHKLANEFLGIWDVHQSPRLEARLRYIEQQRHEWSWELDRCPKPSPPDPPGPKLDRQIQRLKNKYQVERERIASRQSTMRKLDRSAITSMVKGKVNTRRSSDLKDLLRHSRHCDASDARDRVYAFLGLAHRGYGVNPDYSMENTIVHVLIHTARNIIEYDNTLDILQDVSCGREELGAFLPTWVPEWTSKEVNCGFDTYASIEGVKGSPPFYNASNGVPAETAFRYDETNDTNVDLRVKGILLDILDELKGPVHDFPDLRLFEMPGNQKVVAPTSAILDDEVWVLYGASKPVLLRPEGDDTYAFIGEVLVFNDDGTTPSDVMFGSLVQQSSEGHTETREIWLI